MPRAYVRKTDRSSYPNEKLIEAVRAVKSGALSGYAASKHYGIPRATIINRANERNGMKSNTLGRPTVLSQDVEKNLVKNLHAMEKYGFGLTRKELMETVGQYVKAKAVNNLFKNGVPGEDWFLLFKKRHNISVKKPQPMEYARKSAWRPNVIYPYFDLLEETVDQLDLRDKPSHIWNVDETSFSKDPSKAKVVGLKGFTSTISPGKDNTTVLLGCNALGEKTAPLIIYEGKNVSDEWMSQEGYPGTAYAATANGWMETAVFEAWFEKVFLPTVGQKRPILLIYDGPSTHVGINIIEKAQAAQITILKIPPHTSDVLQPLDLAVNKPFKDRWDAALVKWQRSNIGKTLPKNELAKIIGQIWTAIDPDVCAAGFKKAGIYPLNKEIVPESKFDQLLLREWKQTTTSVDNNFVDDKTKSSDICPLREDQQNSQPIRCSSPDLIHNFTFARINSCTHQANSQLQQRQQNWNDLAGCSKIFPETENPKPNIHTHQASNQPQQRQQKPNPPINKVSKVSPHTPQPKKTDLSVTGEPMESEENYASEEEVLAEFVSAKVYPELYSRGQVDILNVSDYSSEEFKFMMVYRNFVTKFTHLKPLKETRVEDTVDALLEVFLMFGAPNILQSKNGMSMANPICRHISKLCSDIKIVAGDTNSFARKFEGKSNEEILKMLSEWLAANKNANWHQGVKYVQHSLNTTFNPKICRTPSEMVFGVNPRKGLASVLPTSEYEILITEDDLKLMLVQNEEALNLGGTLKLEESLILPYNFIKKEADEENNDPLFYEDD